MLENNVQVGKYTLESLTTGMYSDPKIVYREYIQNSVDSLENAILNNLIEPQSMRIDIIVDESESYISIKDNGTGIKAKEVASILMNVGNSQKRNTNNRGFRGIGRLGGMSYCDTLIFTTSAETECIKTKVIFDCKKLRELLIPGANEDMDLSAVLNAVTLIQREEEKTEKHYFLVEMENVMGFSDLLKIETVRSYISQVAPVPYKTKQFLFTNELHKYLLSEGYEVEEFPIFVGESMDDLEPVYKPNRHRFHGDRKKMRNDEILSMKYFDVRIDNELYALGWYGISNWFGQLSERELSGIRVRKGNILIGDSKTLNSIFKEPRFNGWVQGELFIVSDKLIPNARRDDFEQNAEYFKTIDALKNDIGNNIIKLIREASTNRNNPTEKVLGEIRKQINDASKTVQTGFNSSHDKDKLLKNLREKENELNKLRTKGEETTQKEDLKEKLNYVIEDVSESKNYKINQINSGVDKKSKKILAIVSNILSEKLAKPLVDDIIEEILARLNRK